VGIGDTSLSQRQVLNKIAEAVHAAKDGLNQILFVTSGRFTEEEMFTYNLLRTVFFDKDIVKYTTIVRTKFPGFRKPEKCDEDKERMIKETGDISEVIKSCRKVIHVNNLTEEEDPGLRARADSHSILLTHLHNCQDVYKPENLDGLNERIGGFMTEKEHLQKQLDEMKDLTEKQRAEAQKRIKELEEKVIGTTKG